MDAQNTMRARRQKVWLGADAGDIDAFKALVSQRTDIADWPFADAVEQNILLYSGARVADAAADAESRLELMAEWAEVFAGGPGVIAIKGGIADHGVLDRATKVFEGLIEAERATGAGGGDHFAKPGANDRVWNSAEKHCLADPENFAAYFACDGIALASQAWLGPGYQVTAQVNRVNPGGAAQTPHRDYHLGFMDSDRLAGFPAHVHGISPQLTLQGAVAHCDMPLESGPTLLLPYSQQLFEGYLAFGRPEFQAVFAEHHVQLPLEKGDMVFFNPAVMHGAGNNVSKGIQRLANLLQVGSPLGRSIEAVNRARMVQALYPVLVQAKENGALSERQIANAIAAAAEGYAFPTNLDTDPPVGGLNPLTQAEIIAAALSQGTTPEAFAMEIEAWTTRREP